MSVPREPAPSLLRDQVKRGTVLRATLDQSQLDDPTLSSRSKFLIVLAVEPPDSDLLCVLTTSNLSHFASGRWEQEIVRIHRGESPIFPKETVVNCREIHLLPMASVERLASARHAVIVGELEGRLMDRINQTLAGSRLIDPRMKKRVVL